MAKEKISKDKMIEMGMDALDICRTIINSIPIDSRDNHSAKLVLGKGMSTQELYHNIKELKKVLSVIDKYEVEDDIN